MFSTVSIIQLIRAIFDFYNILIIVYCLISWVPVNRGGLLSDFAAALETIVGPFLNIFRRMMPAMGGIDFSPVIAVLALSLIERLLIGILL